LLLPAAKRAAALVTLLGNLRKKRQRFLDPRGALAAQQVVAASSRLSATEIRMNTPCPSMICTSTARAASRAVALVIVSATEAHASGIHRQQSRQRAQHGGLAIAEFGPVMAARKPTLIGSAWTKAGFGNENVAAPSVPALPNKTSRREMAMDSFPIICPVPVVTASARCS
jgi:hypothetical protein